MKETRPTFSEKKGNLKLRLITGAVYVAILIGFYALKLFVSDLFFDVLILLFSILGTYEMIRACRDKLHISQEIIVMTFSALVILTYVLTDFYYADILDVRLPAPDQTVAGVTGRNYSLHITFVVFISGIALLLALLVFAHQKVDLSSVGYSLLCYLYPSFFLIVLAVCNHLEKYSELAILLVFTVCPVSDALAYVFGRLFGRWFPAKMAPNISPKKTLVGGLGGLIGGAIGGIAVFAFLGWGLPKAEALLAAPFNWNAAFTARDVIFFIALGILTSAFSQFGDLVESAIKRKIGIKDMGKLLPGHGGILDRIDSALYGGLIVCFVLVIRIMILG